MVNLVAAVKPLLRGLMKMAGITPHALEIQPGTVINIWIPSENVRKPNRSNKKKTAATTDDDATTKPKRRVVVLVHGFAGDGIFNWLFQVGSLTKKYSVYVPDLLFFGGSVSDSPDRSPRFQAECLAKGLRKLGVEKCTVVGFSYGGVVAFKMAELQPELVEAMVITGSAPAMTDSMSRAMLERIGYSSFQELLLPTSAEYCKKLFRIGAHTRLWIPHRLYKDFVEEMYNHRKERDELLENLVVRNTDASIPKFSQKILLLWGEQDQLFELTLAQAMKKQLGDKAAFEGIKKAGHLVHLERPCLYNACLKQFLSNC